jgi:uncharacterized damage-inducible protein DinB
MFGYFLYFTAKTTMQHSFDILRQTRRNILSIINSHDLDQLNEIPIGFNNNLAWNFGHVLVTQQLLCYRLAGQEVHLGEQWIEAYRKGTKPEGRLSTMGLDYLREQFLRLADQMEEDYNNELFQEYKPYETSFGIKLNSIEEAITFNNVHEGMHLGAMIALRKMV